MFTTDGGYTITFLEFSIDRACAVILAHTRLMFIHTLTSGKFGPMGAMSLASIRATYAKALALRSWQQYDKVQGATITTGSSMV